MPTIFRPPQNAANSVANKAPFSRQLVNPSGKTEPEPGHYKAIMTCTTMVASRQSSPPRLMTLAFRPRPEQSG